MRLIIRKHLLVLLLATVMIRGMMFVSYPVFGLVAARYPTRGALLGYFLYDIVARIITYRNRRESSK